MSTLAPPQDASISGGAGVDDAEVLAAAMAASAFAKASSFAEATPDEPAGQVPGHACIPFDPAQG